MEKYPGSNRNGREQHQSEIRRRTAQRHPRRPPRIPLLPRRIVRRAGPPDHPVRDKIRNNRHYYQSKRFALDVRQWIQRHLPAVKRRRIPAQLRDQRVRPLMAGRRKKKNDVPHHAQNQKIWRQLSRPSNPPVRQGRNRPMRQTRRMKWQSESAGIEMYQTRESKEWHAAAKTKAHAPSAQAAASLLCYSVPRSFSIPVLRQPDSSAKRTSITAARQRKSGFALGRSVRLSNLRRTRDFRSTLQKKRRWLRGLDSNQDSRLQRPMCYQLHHPGMGTKL